MRLQTLFLGMVTLGSMVSAAAVRTDRYEKEIVLDTKYFRKLFLDAFKMYQKSCWCSAVGNFKKLTDIVRRR